MQKHCSASKQSVKLMKRLLIEQFIEEENVEVTNPKTLLNRVQTCTPRETLDLALQDPPLLPCL